MESKWLHDFVALAEQGNFSKAADARFVTQPAFSRRIRSLENWLGVPLVCRERYPMTLTEAGESFLEQARLLLSQIYGIRGQLRQSLHEHSSLNFVVQPSLAVTFFPGWIHQLRPHLGDSLIRLNTGHYHDAIEQFMSGSADFLLCFSCDDVNPMLNRPEVERRVVGQDRLVLVSAVDAAGHPLHALSAEAPLRLLLYPPTSFLGELIQQKCLPALSEQPCLPVCENALGEGLKALALQGDGASILPASLVREELNQGRLVELPLSAWVKLDIELFCRPPFRSEQVALCWQQISQAVT
ncbi:LysR family transcriptional regulator [Oceanisphaera arctica]|uniref:LysR family transcriptional regulator n=1 Tax=Oceanisphaera arctica TaxID=641510 RepID=A0A2P5TPH6_9GAMM|nr:LysR family transcriptional regulator [Oceanisphaera arctica]PPL17548.1 LysR family transcriptional regulator [Oceanisphaera arctica]GHA16348.1 LysR family transcriptional regulator [Oceanisphaera arctica]